MPTLFKFISLWTLLLIAYTSSGQTNHGSLRLVFDKTKEEYGYVNRKGDTVIQLGKYHICYTEKFDKFAIVISREKGIIGIDRKENILFNVYNFDNGPDYPSNGLFRIVKDGKIGYANMNGSIIVPPQYDCAYPFEKGKAKVGKGCKTQTDGEHSWWIGGVWHTIDKKGNIIKQ